MKKIYSLLSLCILFLSCEQDEVINNEPNQENSNTPEISSIKFEEVPQNIINQFYFSYEYQYRQYNYIFCSLTLDIECEYLTIEWYAIG